MAQEGFCPKALSGQVSWKPLWRERLRLVEQGECRGRSGGVQEGVQGLGSTLLGRWGLVCICVVLSTLKALGYVCIMGDPVFGG